MTRDQTELLKADQRRHQALAKYSHEPFLKGLHEALAEALGAAVEDWARSQSELKPRPVPCPTRSIQIHCKDRCRKKRRRSKR